MTGTSPTENHPDVPHNWFLLFIVPNQKEIQMEIKFPKFNIPTKERATKEINKVEGALFLQGLFLMTLLAVRLVLPEEGNS